MNGSLPSLSALKTQAKQLRVALEKRGETISHSQTLELIAQQQGYRDWNTLYAAVGNRPPVLYLRPGDRSLAGILVSGLMRRYLACKARWPPAGCA